MKKPSAYLKDSDAFCMLPWIGMTLAADGRVLPCCIADWNHPIGNTHASTLEEIWNSEGMRSLRLEMLQGKKDPRCSNCHESEQGRFPSLRQDANARFAHHFPSVTRTRQDGSLEKLRMPLMDIRFSNLCNFKCRICAPVASVAWHKDAKALHGYSGPKVLTPTKDPKELWRQIEPLIPDLEEIYFTGGEPLLSDEHYRILDLLVEKRLFNVRLRYHTNLSVLAHKGWNVMELWNRFQYVKVQASLDGMGKRGEYLRKGQLWNQAVRNWKRMSQLCPRVEFLIDATLCVMNVLHLPDFHKEWLDQGLIKPGQWRPHVLITWPEEHSIQILPGSIKRLVREKYERHIEQTLKPLGATEDEAYYRRALSFMEARDKSALLPKFRETTRALDKLRGENFTEIFPELASLMDDRTSPP